MLTQMKPQLRVSVVDPAASTGHGAVTEKENQRKRKSTGYQNHRLLNRPKTYDHLTVPDQK